MSTAIFAADDALLIPTYGDYFTTAWDLGARKAKEILYENRFMTAHEAMQWGFVNRVYPAADLEKETLKYAARVVENNPFTTRTVKFAINQTLDMMGFTTSVRQVSPDFFRMGRARRTPDAPEPSPANSEQVSRDDRFRSQVQRALDYLHEDRSTHR